ncbi:LuxR C-terminal-related transcriptional regulator [Phaeovulum sp.]|uniref:helix-turn-helix transcriptional regulator n=1 Tax=Phaeovulum sp. TaxID=2934796 RepID=UPI0039E55F67
MDLQKYNQTFKKLAPAGFYVALRVGYSFPEQDLNWLPDPWVEAYTARGLVVHDPVMKWVYSQTGITRWDAIRLPDPAGVFALARSLGLRFGATGTISRPEDAGSRSYGTFFRADRDFSDSELTAFLDMLTQLHTRTTHLPDLTPAEITALRMQARGLRTKQIAAEIGISESAVKARLAGARRKLGARNPAQLLSIATTHRLI